MAGFVNHSLDARIQAQLRDNRRKMAYEMRAALRCRTAKQKKALVARWEAQYSATMCGDLLACARDESACRSIAAWEV